MTALLTLPQAAAALGISRQRVWWLVRHGRIEADRLGVNWYITAAEVRRVRGRKTGRPKGTTQRG
jgi:hypothetical protein